jgi:hypothetical protein
LIGERAIEIDGIVQLLLGDELPLGVGYMD